MDGGGRGGAAGGGLTSRSGRGPGLGATADAVLPWEQVANLPPAVAVHLLAGAGHALHWDEPEAVAALLQAPLMMG